MVSKRRAVLSDPGARHRGAPVMLRRALCATSGALALVSLAVSLAAALVAWPAGAIAGCVGAVGFGFACLACQGRR